jgi:predicted RNA binding protein YcfA (HicA-like mRNA interferase family)
MMYIGGPDPHDDEVAWWHPNLSCLTQMLLKLGFAQVAQVGVHRGLLRPADYPFERVVLRAHKRLP